MTDQKANIKRLAKNTLILYVRMLLTIVIALYTSRVVLNSLGAEDFGLYNLVGGTVAMFTAISGTLNAAIGRFITYELGKGNQEKLKRVFSTSINLQVVLVIIFFILAETVGYWYLNQKMVIPQSRVMAVNWAYQFSILSFASSLINIPYNASIIAHEKMSAFAYLAIVDSLGKFLIAWCIAISPIDRLVFYALLMALFSIIICIAYAYYCKLHFEECSYRYVYAPDIIKQMLNFVGWAFIGVTAWALRVNGVIILINVFFGPLVNAAYAIATQVDRAISGFVTNFMTALNPQITKAFAEQNMEYMFNLMFQGARFGYYILLLLAMPILLNTSFVLEVWLKQVPVHAVLFVQLVLLLSMINCIKSPLSLAQIATGKIRDYQIVIGGLELLNIPVAYLCLYLWAIPELVVVVAIVISHVTLVAGLLVLQRMIGVNVRLFLLKVYVNVVAVTVVALVIPAIASFALSHSLSSFLLVSFLSVSCTVLSELYVGCNKKERKLVYDKAKQIAHKYKYVRSSNYLSNEFY